MCHFDADEKLIQLLQSGVHDGKKCSGTWGNIGRRLTTITFKSGLIGGLEQITFTNFNDQHTLVYIQIYFLKIINVKY